MVELPKEIQDRLSLLKEDDVKRLVAMLEAQKKEEELKELEYASMKHSDTIKEMPIMSNTETGEAYNNLDDVNFLDLNTRLSRDEISAVLRFDILQRMSIMPAEAPLTLIFKRLKVSEKGAGRSEKVQIVTGTKSQKSVSGFWDGLLKKRKEDESYARTPQPGNNPTQQ